jgi:outer membrane immunogenic protein
MNKITMMIATAAALLATPAMAETNDNFDGFRIGATAGLDDVTGTVDTNDVVYGVDVGYDFAVGDRLVLGLEGTVTNPLEDSRTIGAAVRAGVAVTDNFMPYVRAGWSNYRDVANRNLDGLTVGAGAEYALGEDFYVKAEYRYSDFEAGVGNHGALVGVGIRF